MRIVRLANFVAPRSGGLRTALAELGAGYLAAGHEPVLVIPGERESDTQTAQGRVITLRAPRVPFTGGYRVLWRRRRLVAGEDPPEEDSAGQDGAGQDGAGQDGAGREPINLNVLSRPSGNLRLSGG